MERLRRRTQPDEQGFTLAELIVYSVLLIVVLGMAGSMFVRLIYAQRDIKALSEANNEAQLVFEQVELDLRNADWAEVSQNGTLLVVRTRLATAVNSTTAVCVGYYYDSSDSTLHRKQTSDSVPTTNALGAGSAGDLKTIASPWNISMTNVATIGSTRVFGPADDIFETPMTIEISLRANTSGNRKPIEFVKSVSLRPQSGLGSGCR